MVKHIQTIRRHIADDDMFDRVLPFCVDDA